MRGGARRAGRRAGRRTARRVVRRQRRRFRRRIMVGGMVMLAVGGAAYGAVKMTQQDAQRIEQHTGASVEELSEDELIQAMQDLGIQSVDLTEDDRAVIARESSSPSIEYADSAPQEPAQAPAAPAASASDTSYIEELERLADLVNRGIISQEDFEAKKKQLLGL